MSKQAADHVQWNILVDELHTHRVPELMRLEVVQLSRLVANLLFVSPLVECAGKRSCLKWKVVRQRAWEQVLAGVSPLLTNISLLCLNRRYHGLIYQGNDMFLLGLPLGKVEIPCVASIMFFFFKQKTAYEMASGSIRIHRRDIQMKMFQM